MRLDLRVFSQVIAELCRGVRFARRIHSHLQGRGINKIKILMPQPVLDGSAPIPVAYDANAQTAICIKAGDRKAGLANRIRGK